MYKSSIPQGLHLVWTTVTQALFGACTRTVFPKGHAQ